MLTLATAYLSISILILAVVLMAALFRRDFGLIGILFIAAGVTMIVAAGATLV